MNLSALILAALTIQLVLVDTYSEFSSWKRTNKL